jgi:hypothetical protein
MHSYHSAHCALARDRSRIVRSPFTGRFPFSASPLRSRLANASGRIEFIIVFFMDWSFASGCSPPRLSTTQLPLATDRPVPLSDGDFHLTIGAYSQAHSSTAFRALAPPPLCETSTRVSVLERKIAPRLIFLFKRNPEDSGKDWRTRANGPTETATAI